MILKPCNHAGCGKLVSYPNKYCELHQDTDKQRYKSYAKTRTDQQEQAFYRGNTWAIVRDLCIKNCYAIDIVSYYIDNIIVKGQTVHHIIELKEDYDLRAEQSNLIYLTYSNHKRVHDLYNRSSKDKAYVQNMLKQLKARFNAEFGVGM